MCRTSNRYIGLSPSRSPFPTLRNIGPVLVLTREIRAALSRVFRYSSRVGWQGHLLSLVTSFIQPRPSALAMLKVVSDLHSDRNANTGKAVNHGSDQRATANPIKVVLSIESNSLCVSSDDSTGGSASPNYAFWVPHRICGINLQNAAGGQIGRTTAECRPSAV